MVPVEFQEHLSQSLNALYLKAFLILSLCLLSVYSVNAINCVRCFSSTLVLRLIFCFCMNSGRFERLPFTVSHRTPYHSSGTALDEFLTPPWCQRSHPSSNFLFVELVLGFSSDTFLSRRLLLVVGA